MLITIFFIPFIGCQFSSPPASEVALSYYKLLIHQDASQIISLNIMDEEMSQLVIDNVNENLRQQILSDLSVENRITLSDDQIYSIQEAYLALLKQLDCHAISSPNGNTQIVTLTSSCVDFNTLTNNATQLALNQVNISDYRQHADYLSDLIHAYIIHLIKGYETAKPLEITQETHFVFTKKNGLWLPEDYEAFTKELCMLIDYNESLQK